MSKTLRYRRCYLKALHCSAKHSDCLNSLTLKPIYCSPAPAWGVRDQTASKCFYKAHFQPGRPGFWEHSHYFRHFISAHPFNNTPSSLAAAVPSTNWSTTVSDDIQIKMMNSLQTTRIQVSFGLIRACVGLK